MKSLNIMKTKIFTLVGICLLFFTCQTEPIETDNLSADTTKKKGQKPKDTSSNDDVNYVECNILDIDRSPYQGIQPTANFWWSASPTGSDYNDPNAYFSQDDSNNLTWREYDNGTARIFGTTAMGTCVLTVDVWLKDKKTWDEWQAIGGEHKKEGTAGLASNSEDMHFYVIDEALSSVSAAGGDCLQEGDFGIEQRPDPNDPNTPNFGAHFGPGGANFDSDIDAIGLSTWGWFKDLNTGERLWLVDFNFKLECEPECETAFAKGNSGDDHACFDEGGFSRWGWNIGPLSEGTYTYNVYAAAGQCNIENGYLAGTVTIEYGDGTASASYDLFDGYELEEEHFYAGVTPYPLKNNGSYTVAPGQYYVEDELSGDIYVIAHAVVCED